MLLRGMKYNKLYADQSSKYFIIISNTLSLDSEYKDTCYKMVTA